MYFLQSTILCKMSHKTEIQYCKQEKVHKKTLSLSVLSHFDHIRYRTASAAWDSTSVLSGMMSFPSQISLRFFPNHKPKPDPKNTENTCPEVWWTGGVQKGGRGNRTSKKAFISRCVAAENIAR